MVRSIIGTILEIGQSKISNKELINIIDKSDRIYAGPSVPAHGLLLTKVEYPDNIFVQWVVKPKYTILSFLKGFWNISSRTDIFL